MQKIKMSFSESAKELKRTKSLVATAMLIALYLVLEWFSYAITPILPTYLRISFSFLAIGLIGSLYGPVTGGISGVVADLLACLLYPRGAWFPGFTFTALITGMIFGLGFYRKELTLLRVFLTRLCVVLFCNIGLNTIWTSIIAHKAIYAIIWTRVLKNLAVFPVEVILFYALSRAVKGALEKFR